MDNEQSRAELIAAALAVVQRWESPDWKDGTHTRDYIYRLRDAAIAAQQAQPVQQPVAYEFHNTKTGHAIVDYSNPTHRGWLNAEDGYVKRPLVYADPTLNRVDAQPVQQPLAQALRNPPEFNMNGYDDDDVRRLHDWAVSVVHLAEQAQPAQGERK